MLVSVSVSDDGKRERKWNSQAAAESLEAAAKDM